jgi:hypothetical protein
MMGLTPEQAAAALERTGEFMDAAFSSEAKHQARMIAVLDLIAERQARTVELLELILGRLNVAAP